MVKKQVIFIGFYTEGKPFDKGIDLRPQRDIFLEEKKNLFDKVLLFSPRSLIKKDNKWEAILFNKEYLNSHINSNQRKSSINIGWIKLNSLLWKPAIIWEIINNENITDDSIIIYHDLNILKYPFYMSNFEKLNKFFKKKLQNKSIALCNHSLAKLSIDCKQELIRNYLGSEGNSLIGLWAGCIGLKKNKYSREFCKYWLELTNITENRSQLTKFDLYPSFAWHSQEQATLTIAYYRWIFNFKKSKNITTFYTLNCREISLKWSLRNKILFLKRLYRFILRDNNVFKLIYERLMILYFANFKK